jgi:hypothetical protein
MTNNFTVCNRIIVSFLCAMFLLRWQVLEFCWSEVYFYKCFYLIKLCYRSVLIRREFIWDPDPPPQPTIPTGDGLKTTQRI